MSTQRPRNDSPGLPTLFIDRSVGGKLVPNGLRDLGLDVVTLSEHYGVKQGETIEDVEWLLEAGRQGWAVLKADARIRHRPAERAALIEAKAQAFLLGGQLSAAQQVARIEANLDAMVNACLTPGPWVYRIHQSRLQRLKLD